MSQGLTNPKLQANDGVDIGDVTINNSTGGSAVNIQDGGNSITVDGSLTTVSTVSTITNVVHVDDNSSTLSIDDGAGSITVDGTVAVSGAVDTELTTADLDTGGGTDTRAVVGLVGSASGGGQLIPGSSTDGLLVNLGANNDVTITGTVAVTQSGTWDEVGINDSGNSITVDNTVLSVVGGGTEATAQRVTIASDSTGVVSVDDNGSSLTVDGSVSISGTVAVTQSGTWDEVGINDSGNSITVDGTVTATNEVVSTSTLTNVSGSATSVQLLASTSGRKGAYFYNDSTASLYLKFGTTASTSSFTVLMRPYDYYEIPQPIYTGRIDGIWSSANGAVRITELT